MPSSSPSSVEILLRGVAATSTRHAWAVGGYGQDSFPSHEALILRWNGTAWR